jgi:predicted PhzF superfamily epimerase YddE/YHI9
MTHTIYQVDAFTHQPFKGNPAAVCLLSEPADEKWMQHVACEMNLSETAFVVRQAEGFGLRWFTPAAEVDLCGHATLASAHILFETGVLQVNETARFQTRSGLLMASRHTDWIKLDFPVTPEEAETPPPGLLEALGAPARYVGKNIFDYLVELDDETTLRKLKPDFTALQTLHVRGIIVTSRSASPAFDFISRFFAPGVGVNEDPVTGSAHCCLAPYWSSRLGKQEMVAYQASARGGLVRVQLAGERVFLFGQAVTVMRGELFA